MSGTDTERPGLNVALPGIADDASAITTGAEIRDLTERAYDAGYATGLESTTAHKAGTILALIFVAGLAFGAVVFAAAGLGALVRVLS